MVGTMIRKGKKRRSTTTAKRGRSKTRRTSVSRSRSRGRGGERTRSLRIGYGKWHAKYTQRDIVARETKEACDDIQHNDLALKRIKMSVGKPHRCLYKRMSSSTLIKNHENKVLDPLVTGTSQSVWQLPAAVTKSDVTTSWYGPNRPVTSNDTQLPIGLFYANPDRGHYTGNATGTAGYPPYNANPDSFDDQIYLKSVKQTIDVKSCTTAPQEFFIFWFLCIKSTNDAPAACWSNVLGGNTGGLPDTAMGGQMLERCGSVTIQHFGEFPQSNLGFRKMWKQLHSTHFILQGGATRRHAVQISYNKFLNQRTFSEVDRTHFAGYTVCPLIIVRPVLAFDTSVVDSSQGMVMCTADYGVFTQTRFNICFPPGKRNVYTKISAVGNLIGDATPSNKKEIDDTDQIADVRNL